MVFDGMVVFAFNLFYQGRQELGTTSSWETTWLGSIRNFFGDEVKIFNPDISLAKNTKLKGNISSDSKNFKLDFTSPKVMAYDINLNAQRVCSELAKKNSVSDRVLISGLFTLDNLTSLDASSTLILCDIEGAEKELLDPQKSSALKCVDIIVESHECLIPGVTQLLINRFNESHEISLVRDNGQRSLDAPPQWFINLAHLDQLLATWEWRSGPTPWLVMIAR